MKGSEDSLVTLPEQRGQDMLAYLLAPEMVGAVAPRQIAGVEIDPVRVGAPLDAESCRAGSGGRSGRLRSKRSGSIPTVSTSIASWGMTFLTTCDCPPNITRKCREWNVLKCRLNI